MHTETRLKSNKFSVLDRPLRILHLEDSLDDRRMIQQWLKDQSVAAEFTDVDNEADFVKAFEEKPFDIILSDNSLPGFDGMTALRLAQERCPHIPFVFVTGSMGEEAAIETMKVGATDYVLKDRLSRLVPALQRAIHDSEQEERNREIGEKNREQAALLAVAQDAILVTDLEDRILFWNKSAERMYGWPATVALGRNATVFLPTDPVGYHEAKKILLAKGNWTGELVSESRMGDALVIEGRWTLMRDSQGKPQSILMIDTDITEKKALETKFLRSQRMDSIGALAGGIAHDLNNALAPVLMSVELIKTIPDESDREKFLNIITTSAQRATELVKQILNFARGSGGRSGPVNLSQLISDIGKMIQDTFPKSIRLSVKVPDEGLWTIQGDDTELHQVLLNLCVNARDAMPQGGQLTLAARNHVVSEATALAAGAIPGPYVMVSVTDTGSGIPPEVLPRIFEPFYTTKTGGQGTGLGLATVAGIVKHHRGFIDIRTQSGQGTEFQVYFPSLGSAASAEAKPNTAVLPTGHGELILLTDDEEALLELTKTMLESYGYRVVTAQNGLQGIARFKENPNEIKLIISDSDMPQMSGVEMIRAINELNPDIPVIVASGYNHYAGELRELNPRRLERLDKPYTLDQLLIAVNKGLHQGFSAV